MTYNVHVYFDSQILHDDIFRMEIMNELNYFNDYNDNKMGDIFLLEVLVNIMY